MVKLKTKVHKYRRNDGTPVRTHTRKIDVDVFKPEKPDNTFENKDDSPSINIDKDLVQRKKEITKEELESIDEYGKGIFNSKLGGYTTINNYLREGKLPSETNKKEIDNTIKNINSAIKKSSISEDKTVYRGIKKGFENKQKGDIISDKAFLSTTTSRSIANKFTEKLNRDENPALLKINLKKGDSAYKMMDKHEKEILLLKNQPLKITNISNFKGARQIEVSLVNN